MMKYRNLFLTFLILLQLNSTIVWSQTERRSNSDFSQEISYTKDEYNKILKSSIDNSVTREDNLSIDLIEFSFASKRNGNYLAVAIVTFSEYDPITNKKKEVVQELVIEELIRINNTEQNFTKGFKNLISNKNIENTHTITIELVLTRLNKDQEKEFTRIFNGILENIPSPKLIKKILKIDENTTIENTDKISMDAQFFIPLNFLEYNKLKYSTPMLKDNEAIYIAIIDKNLPASSNNNIKNWFKSKINKISNFFAGKDILNNRISITGIAKLKVTKSANISLPKSIKELMVTLTDEIFDNDQEDIQESIDAIEKMTKDYHSQGYINMRTKDNIIYFTSLASTYKRLLECKSKISSVEKKRKMFIDFVQWHDRSSQYANNWQFSKIKISDIYKQESIFEPNPINPKNPTSTYVYRNAIIYLPYSIDNKFILHASNWQFRLHSFCKDLLDDNPDLKTELETISNLSKLKYNNVTP